MDEVTKSAMPLQNSEPPSVIKDTSEAQDRLSGGLMKALENLNGVTKTAMSSMVVQPDQKIGKEVNLCHAEKHTFNRETLENLNGVAKTMISSIAKESQNKIKKTGDKTAVDIKSHKNPKRKEYKALSSKKTEEKEKRFQLYEDDDHSGIHSTSRNTKKKNGDEALHPKRSQTTMTVKHVQDIDSPLKGRKGERNQELSSSPVEGMREELEEKRNSLEERIRRIQERAHKNESKKMKSADYNSRKNEDIPFDKNQNYTEEPRSAPFYDDETQISKLSSDESVTYNLKNHSAVEEDGRDKTKSTNTTGGDSVSLSQIFKTGSVRTFFNRIQGYDCNTYGSSEEFLNENQLQSNSKSLLDRQNDLYLRGKHLQNSKLHEKKNFPPRVPKLGQERHIHAYSDSESSCDSLYEVSSTSSLQYEQKKVKEKNHCWTSTERKQSELLPQTESIDRISPKMTEHNITKKKKKPLPSNSKTSARRPKRPTRPKNDEFVKDGSSISNNSRQISSEQMKNSSTASTEIGEDSASKQKNVVLESKMALSVLPLEKDTATASPLNLARSKSSQMTNKYKKKKKFRSLFISGHKSTNKK